MDKYGITKINVQTADQLHDESKAFKYAFEGENAKLKTKSPQTIPTEEEKLQNRNFGGQTQTRNRQGRNISKFANHTQQYICSWSKG